MRGGSTDKFLQSCERRREKEFKDNTENCENYSQDNSKEGTSCIYPWCDYCSFYCPRRVPEDEDTAT